MVDAQLRRLLSLARRGAGTLEDAQLLERFATAGDEAAFELLVWRHGAMVFGVCRRILGDSHAAEDALQATFLALARQAKGVRRNTLAGWLHRVARRAAVRAKARTCRASAAERRAAAVPSYVERPADGDARAVIDGEIDRLPAKLRQAVVLCYLDGLTTRDAAARLGCPRGTVLSRLAAARRRLRGRLTRRGLVPATLPVALVPPTVRAAVEFAKGHAWSGEAALLAEGVIHAMTWNKLKLIAAGLVTAGVLGLGWGVGPDPTLGTPQAARAGGSDKAEPRAGDDARAREELSRVLDAFRVEEEKASAQRVELKLGLAAAEQKLQRAERENALRRDTQAARIRLEEAGIVAAQDELRLVRLMRGGEHAEIAVCESRVKACIESRRKAESELQQGDEQWSKVFQDARSEVIRAEEALQKFERLSAVMRRGTIAAIERLQDRSLPGGDGGSRPRDVERKIEDLAREIAELRRELKK